MQGLASRGEAWLRRVVGVFLLRAAVNVLAGTGAQWCIIPMKALPPWVQELLLYIQRGGDVGPDIPERAGHADCDNGATPEHRC